MGGAALMNVNSSSLRSIQAHDSFTDLEHEGAFAAHVESFATPWVPNSVETSGMCAAHIGMDLLSNGVDCFGSHAQHGVPLTHSSDSFMAQAMETQHVTDVMSAESWWMQLGISSSQCCEALVSPFGVAEQLSRQVDSPMVGFTPPYNPFPNVAFSAESMFTVPSVLEVPHRTESEDIVNTEAVNGQTPVNVRPPIFTKNNSANSASDEFTTVMLRNMPNNYTRAHVLEMLASHGFAGEFDFLYLPMDFKSQACLGYAFVNLGTHASARRFWNIFDGFHGWVVASRKIASVSWSGPHQGLAAHINRFRNSSVMHESMPDEYKPIILRDGARVPFPRPTQRLRAPLQRRHQGH